MFSSPARRAYSCRRVASPLVAQGNSVIRPGIQQGVVLDLEGWGMRPRTKSLWAVLRREFTVLTTTAEEGPGQSRTPMRNRARRGRGA
jgi:hypothetical protein